MSFFKSSGGSPAASEAGSLLNMGRRELHGNAGWRNSIALRERDRRELFRRRKVQFDWVAPIWAILAPVPSGGGFREDTMHKAMITGLALMLSCLAADAPAQVTPPQPQDGLAPAPKLNPAPQQRHTITEFVKDMKADAADVKTEIGDPIPQGITPRPMPAEVAQKVPQVKSHRFFLTAQQIVIVDPKDNKVADVIKLGTQD